MDVYMPPIPPLSTQRPLLSWLHFGLCLPSFIACIGFARCQGSQKLMVRNFDPSDGLRPSRRRDQHDVCLDCGAERGGLLGSVE